MRIADYKVLGPDANLNGPFDHDGLVYRLSDK